MVKNVRPGALAGNLTPLDPADAEVPQDDDTVANDPLEQDPVGVEVPAGDLETRLAWVRESEDADARSARASALWAHEQASDPDGDHEQLADQLRRAVYRHDEVEGELEESETAGTGEAVNAETGEVTQPGDPLPTIEQADGDTLQPASGDDTDPVAPESSDDGNAPENGDSSST